MGSNRPLAGSQVLPEMPVNAALLANLTRRLAYSARRFADQGTVAIGLI